MKRVFVLLFPLLALSACKEPSRIPVPPPPTPSTTLLPTTIPTTQNVATRQPARYKYVGSEHLHNAYIVTDKIVSGAQPDDDEGFAQLQKLGIKTVLSVDGAPPDVESAKKYGLKYVHLPIGYDGVPEDRAKQIAKALNDLPGPIYVHCHHGKHRSAGALATACVMNGMIKPEEAESILQTFGTGKNYKGLWKSALTAKPLALDVIESTQVEYVEIAKTDDLVKAMVHVDESHDRLKLLQKSKWLPPAYHPDLSAAHEALILEEYFNELMRTKHTHEQTPEYQKLMKQNQTSAASLRTALESKDYASADKHLKQVGADCLSCHKIYRD